MTTEFKVGELRQIIADSQIYLVLEVTPTLARFSCCEHNGFGGGLQF